MPEEKRIPTHVALIVDGNRRWARACETAARRS